MSRRLVVGALGVTLLSGLIHTPAADVGAKPAPVLAPSAQAALLDSRTTVRSTRSMRRKPPKPSPSPAAPPPVHTVHTAQMPVRSGLLSPAAARALGQQLAAGIGWVGQQWTCLNELWTRESNWRSNAWNHNSGAGGIPQALPASKMGPGWQTSTLQQITWGLHYIKVNYGTPCGAWNHELRAGWY